VTAAGSENDVKAAARELFERDPIERHPLFVELAGGDLSLDQVRSVALQIHHVVDHFPRLLAAMLANMRDHRLRMPLVENLFEEHGRMDPARVHVETYRAFLEGLGIDRHAIARSEPAICVLAYNRAVLDLCFHHPQAEGLGALGIIEEIVARVSPVVARIVRSMREGGGSLVHFSDHEVLDLTHADEIYELASQAVLLGENRETVILGMRLGWYYHRRLYADLLAMARGRLVP
jgi:pyrroloquinoline quinone (PQQ) biosynthesis protein C